MIYKQIVKMRNIHNHDNDPKDVELKRLKAIVKVRALQTVENPAQVSITLKTKSKSHLNMSRSSNKVYLKSQTVHLN